VGDQMSKIKFLFQVFGVLVLLFFVFLIIQNFFYINNVNNKDNNSTLEKVSFRLSYIINQGNAGEIVAKEEGIFEKAGLNVEILPGGFELDPNKLVAIKEATFGFPKAEEYLIAKSKGLPIVAIAAVFQKNPTAFAVMSDSNIFTPKDFEGKTVGVKYGTNTEIIYNWLLNKENVNKNKIISVPLKFDVTPFLERKIDVYPGFITGDFIQIQQKGFNIRVIDPTEYGLSMYGNVIIVHENTIKNNPKLIISFLKSLKAGWQQAYALDLNKVVGYLKKNNSALSGDLSVGLTAYHEYIFDKNMLFGQMDENDWTSAIDLLNEQGLLEKDLNVQNVFESKFINQVNEMN
jgi:ABC-type nitrate/sulfonate/bicarbonate transport system substrate-binding protein